MLYTFEPDELTELIERAVLIALEKAKEKPGKILREAQRRARMEKVEAQTRARLEQIEARARMRHELDELTLTSSEVKKTYGMAIYNAARLDASLHWMPYGKGGRTSGVYCLREAFRKFLFTREFEFNKK